MASFQGVGSFSPDDFTIKLKAMQQIADRQQRTFEGAANRAHQAALQSRAQQAAAAQQMKALQLEAARSGLKLDSTPDVGVNIPILGFVGNRGQTTLSPDPNSPAGQILQQRMALGQQEVAQAGLTTEAATRELDTQKRLDQLNTELAELNSLQSRDGPPTPEEASILSGGAGAIESKFPVASRRRRVEDAEFEKLQAEIAQKDKLLEYYQSQIDLNRGRTVSPEAIDKFMDEHSSEIQPLIESQQFSEEEMRSAVSGVMAGTKSGQTATMNEVFAQLRVRKDLEKSLDPRNDPEVITRTQKKMDDQGNIGPSPVDTDLNNMALSLPEDGIDETVLGKRDLAQNLRDGDFGRVRDVINASISRDERNKSKIIQEIRTSFGDDFILRIADEESGVPPMIKNLMLGPVGVFFGKPPAKDKAAAGEIIKTLGLEERFRAIIPESSHAEYLGNLSEETTDGEP